MNLTEYVTKFGYLFPNLVIWLVIWLVLSRCVISKILRTLNPNTVINVHNTQGSSQYFGQLLTG